LALRRSVTVIVIVAPGACALAAGPAGGAGTAPANAATAGIRASAAALFRRWG